MNKEPLSEPEDGSPAPADLTTDDAAASDQVSPLQRERDDYYDRWLRTSAEFDNYRKRIERERREQADRAVTGLLEELLLVMDDFDRALDLTPSDDVGGAYRKG